MRSVGDEPLHEARESVQYAGGFPSVQVEAPGDVFGYRSGGDDGDGVVGGTQVGDADQCGDAQFGTPLAPHVAGQAGDDEVDAAVVADGFEHASGKQGDDDELAHAGDARAHGAEPVENGVTCPRGSGGGADADDSRREDAKQQHQHDVDARHGGAQHEEIGDDLQPLYGR